MINKNRQNIYSAIICLIVFFVVFSFENTNINAETIQTTPVSLINTYADDPKTTRAFSWYTDTTIRDSVVQLVSQSEYEDSNSFKSSTVITVRGDYYLLQASPAGNEGNLQNKDFVSARHIHKVQATGLKPGTTYFYRAGDGNQNWSSVYKIKTESEENDTFTFLNFTDSQYYYHTYEKVLKDATEQYCDASFILHCGDLIEYGEAWDYDKVSDMTSQWESSFPMMMTPGNHDLKFDFTISDLGNQFASPVDLYKARYTFPNNGPENQKQLVYSFEYGNAFFAVLNNALEGYKGCTDQLDWLKKDASNSEKTWKILSLHYGPYGIDENMNPDLVKTIEELGFDLVLFGHNHSLLRSDFINGIVYYSSGRASGPAKSSISTNDGLFELYINPLNTPTYGAITVSKGSIIIETRGSLDKPDLIDTFEISKRKKCNHDSIRNYIVTKKATLKHDGASNMVCSCGEVIENTIIHKIDQVKLKKSSITYTGNKISGEKLPAIVVKDEDGSIISSKHYSIIKPQNVKNVGRYAYKVTFKGAKYAGSKTIYLEVKPKAVKQKQPSATKTAITVKWRNQNSLQISGYQILMSANKNFTRDKKRTFVKNRKSASKKISKLKPGQKYYIKIRTYKNVSINGKKTKIYSEWSNVKTCVTKKG